MRSPLHRLKAATLTLAVLVVLAAAAFPPCANASCCARTEETAVEAPMECCKETSLSPRDAVDSLAATASPSPRSAAAVAFETPIATAAFPPPVETPLAVPPPRLHDPDPPLFLLNEQFRI